MLAKTTWEAGYQGYPRNINHTVKLQEDFGMVLRTQSPVQQLRLSLQQLPGDTPSWDVAPRDSRPSFIVWGKEPFAPPVRCRYPWVNQPQLEGQGNEKQKPLGELLSVEWPP